MAVINAKGRKPIGMCCLRVDDLFITGTPEFLDKFKKVVKSQFKIGHEDVNDLMFTGQRVKWIIDEKTKKKSHITVEQSLCVSELTEVVIPIVTDIYLEHHFPKFRNLLLEHQNNYT